MSRAVKRRVWVTAGLALVVVVTLLALRLTGGDGEAGQAAAVAGAAPPARVAPPERSHSSNRLVVRVPARADAALVVRKHERVPLRTAKDGGRLVSRLQPQTAFGSRTTLAVVRIEGRWAEVISSELPNGEFGWVKLDRRRLSYYATSSRIDVDLSTRRATLLVDGKPRRSFPVSVGAPGSDTPTGRFAVTDTFRGLHNPSYGCCALALNAHQPFLPSGWLGGNRIAIHGTYGPIGFAISHGCVRAANASVRTLIEHVPIGSRVDIHD